MNDINDLKLGDKINATIRHCNKKLNEDDKTVNLIVCEDGCYFLDEKGRRTAYELSWSWDIIDYILISED